MTKDETIKALTDMLARMVDESHASQDVTGASIRVIPDKTIDDACTLLHILGN